MESVQDGSVGHDATTLKRGLDKTLKQDTGALHEPRRGRKKRQTRDALIDAALDLFEAKGYEHTTVHEITDAIDVAERTFFRYFAGKEDLALCFIKQEMDEFVAALRARPPDEQPLEAVRSAFRQSLEKLQAEDDLRNGEPRYLTVVRLIDSTPALLAASLSYVYENGGDAVAVLAERENVDPDVDRRPWLLIAIYGALMALVHREWRHSGRGGVEDMLTRFDAYASDLGPTIAGSWNPSRH